MSDCTNSVWMKRTVLSEHNIAATELLEKKREMYSRTRIWLIYKSLYKCNEV